VIYAWTPSVDLSHRFISSEKEQELGDLEGEASSANATLQQAQSLLSSLKTQLKAKKDELKGLTDYMGLTFNPYVTSRSPREATQD
jgi:DNA repair protein RAD50